MLSYLKNWNAFFVPLLIFFEDYPGLGIGISIVLAFLIFIIVCFLTCCKSAAFPIAVKSAALPIAVKSVALPIAVKSAALPIAVKSVALPIAVKSAALPIAGKNSSLGVTGKNSAFSAIGEQVRIKSFLIIKILVIAKLYGFPNAKEN